MKNATFTWEYPTTRIEGGPLAPEDIQGAEVSLRVLGAPVDSWAVLGDVAHPVSEFTQNNLELGSYDVRVVVLTKDGQRGAPAILPFPVVDDSPAGPVTELAVGLS